MRVTRILASLLLILIFLLSANLITGPGHVARASTNPSLYYTQAELDALKALQTSPSHSTIWSNFISWCNTHVNDSPPDYTESRADLTVKKFLENMVFAYHMTDDTAYADAAVSWMVNTANWKNWTVAGSTATISRCELSLGMSNGYYALRDYMSPSDRTFIRDAIVSAAGVGFLYNRFAPFGSYQFPNTWLGNMTVTGVGVGVAALALGSDYQYSSDWLDFSYDCIDYVLGMGVNSGGLPEGPSYYVTLLQALVPYCDILKRINGKDYFKTHHSFFSQTGYYAIYMTIVNPSVGQVKMQMEDAAGHIPWNYEFTCEFFYKLANEYDNGYVQTLANSYSEQDTAMSYIWKKSGLTPLAFSGLPLHRTFSDIGYEIWRVSWDNNSLVFLFKSGRSLGHAHPNQNHYCIYKNGAPLTCGIGYAASWTEYKSYCFNNCLTVGNIHATWPGGDGKLYGYGQAHEPGDLSNPVVPLGTVGEILGTAYTDVYYYVAGDASDLYTGQTFTETQPWPIFSSGRLTKWVRHVVFFPDIQYFVMYDDVVSPTPQQVNWWYRAADLFNEDHSENPPSLTYNNGLITQVIGDKRLEIKMLEPATPNYTIDSNAGLYYSEFSYILLWPPTDTTTPKFLTVMTVDNHLSTGNITPQEITQGNLIGAMVDSGAYRDLALFSADGKHVSQYIELGGYYESADGNTYTFSGTQVLADFDTYKVMRLEPGTGYQPPAVNQPPVLSAIGNKSVRQQQTLEFTVSATDPNGDPLTYSASNLPSGASFNPSTRTFSWTPTLGQAGTYPGVQFSVSDNGSLSDSESATINVTANSAPVLAYIGDKTTRVGVPLQFTVSATDPDSDPLTYSASNLPSWAIFNPSTRSFSGTANQLGTYANIHFEVSDGLLNDAEEITISVVAQLPEGTGNMTPSRLSSNRWLWLIAGFAIIAIVAAVIWLRRINVKK